MKKKEDFLVDGHFKASKDCYDFLDLIFRLKSEGDK
jgi:hypothetical protein